jgi:hypothetical protein
LIVADNYLDKTIGTCAADKAARKTLDVRQAIELLSLDLYRGALLATEFHKRQRMVHGGCLRRQIRAKNKATKA